MCGRYLRRSDKQRIAEAFHLGGSSDDYPLPPDYNIAPATFQPVIRLNRDTGECEMVIMRWGLVPYFAKNLADWKGFSSINAKAQPFRNRRCAESLRPSACWLSCSSPELVVAIRLRRVRGLQIELVQLRLQGFLVRQLRLIFGDECRG